MINEYIIQSYGLVGSEHLFYTQEIMRSNRIGATQY